MRVRVFVLQVTFKREDAALQARYKKVLLALRQHVASEKANAKQTGGGTANPPPKLKVEMTGEILQLKQYYGHILNGLESFDSDGATTSTSVSVAATESLRNRNVRDAFFDATENLDSNSSSVGNGNDNWNLLNPIDLPRRTETVTSVSTSMVAVVKPNQTPNAIFTPSIVAASPTPTQRPPTRQFSAKSQSNAFESSEEIPSSQPPTRINTIDAFTHHTPSSTQQPPPRQFFPTNAQRRRPHTEVNSAHFNLMEMRRKLVDEERHRMEQFHQLRMDSYRMEYAERIAEIRQRRELQDAIHRKQVEFWVESIEAVRRQSGGVNGNEAVLPSNDQNIGSSGGENNNSLPAVVANNNSMPAVDVNRGNAAQRRDSNGEVGRPVGIVAPVPIALPGAFHVIEEIATDVNNRAYIASNAVRTLAMTIERPPTYESVVDEAMRNAPVYIIAGDSSSESNYDRQSYSTFDPDNENSDAEDPSHDENEHDNDLLDA